MRRGIIWIGRRRGCWRKGGGEIETVQAGEGRLGHWWGPRGMGMRVGAGWPMEGDTEGKMHGH